MSNCQKCKRILTNTQKQLRLCCFKNVCKPCIDKIKQEIYQNQRQISCVCGKVLQSYQDGQRDISLTYEAIRGGRIVSKSKSQHKRMNSNEYEEEQQKVYTRKQMREKRQKIIQLEQNEKSIIESRAQDHFRVKKMVNLLLKVNQKIQSQINPKSNQLYSPKNKTSAFRALQQVCEVLEQNVKLVGEIGKKKMIDKETQEPQEEPEFENLLDLI